MATVRAVEIDGPGIRLGQLLKLAGLVESGADVKALLADGSVAVNGAVETRRARQLTVGDLVECAGEEVRVTALA